MSYKKKSVAEKIDKILCDTAKPFVSDDEADETKAKTVDYDSESEFDVEDFKDEFNKSNLRKRNSNLLEEYDKRYSAKKVPKIKIFNQDDDSEDSVGQQANDSNDNISDDNDETASNSESERSEEAIDSDGSEGEQQIDGPSDEKHSTSSQRGSSESSDDDYDKEESDCDGLDKSIDLSNPLRRDRGKKQNSIITVTGTNFRAEIEKGNAVKKQLQLWENLLEVRIKFQKCLVDSNKFPQHDVYSEYSKNNQFTKDNKILSSKLSNLLSNLLDLQSKLLNQYPETKSILSKNERSKAEKTKPNNEIDSMDEEIPSDFEDGENESKKGSESESDDTDDEALSDKEEDEEVEAEPPKKKIKFHRFEGIIAKNHKTYKEYRNSVIQKWNDKVRIATGAVSKGSNQSALQQIEFVLANKDKLKKKTQLKRSEYDIVGKTACVQENDDGRRVQEYDSEIFDDDDFYHQLLKELIEFKSIDIQDPLKLSQQWVQLQNMRSKMKRKIDTKATKGRRLRYNVHQKLVNFMAPITVNDTWTNHAKNELYSSLFGKVKPAS
ncbi:protein AATF [Copidosoma floridanum]|uniref:protein AATF n=1 Tax=Copidosoma floridanum TaxID=29053 RepID=UPI0006C9D63A|nr:protein AATF [Copidosoma floridanum]